MPLLRWMEAFLTNRQQSKNWAALLGMDRNLGHCATGHLAMSALLSIYGNDLNTECPAIKYVADTTIYHTSSNPEDQTVHISVTAPTG